MSTKEALEQAAEHLVVEQGFAATTARDLARAAGVPLGAVNYHYASTDELLVLGLARVIDRWVGESVEATRVVQEAGGDGAAQLAALQLAAERQMTSSPLEAAAFFEALGLAGRREDVHLLMADRLSQSVSALTSLLHSALGPEGDAEQRDAAALARFLIALRDGAAAQVLLGDTPPAAEKALPLLGLLVGPAPEGDERRAGLKAH